MKPNSALNVYFPQQDHLSGEALREELLRQKLLELENAMEGISPLVEPPRIARQLANGAFRNTEGLGDVLAAGVAKSTILLPPHEYYEAPDTAGGVLIFTQALRTVITAKLPRFRLSRKAPPPTPRTLYMFSLWSDLRTNHVPAPGFEQDALDHAEVAISPERAQLVPSIESFNLGIAAMENSVYCFAIGENPNYNKIKAIARVEDAHSFNNEPIQFGPIDQQVHRAQHIALSVDIYSSLVTELDLMTAVAGKMPRPEPQPQKRRFFRRRAS